MRTSFVNQLLKEARVNNKIFLLVGDLGYHVVEPFALEFPDRFLNVGIAEQNMAGVAAGLAMTGFNVFIYSIGNFPTLRCIEQIRNDIAYHYANVKIISIGAGYAYGSQGVTHQATEDIGAIRVIPNMIVASPGDPIEAQEIAKIASSYNGPMYIRLGKSGENVVHANKEIKLSIGDICVIRHSIKNKTAVFACGSIVDSVLKQIDEYKLPYNLYSIPFIKPINISQLLSIIESNPNGIITIEEHQKSCGMGSSIIELINDLYAQGQISKYPIVNRVAIPDEFVNVVGTQAFLREYVHLSLI